MEEQINISDLVIAHTKLMQAYAHALDEVRQMKWLRISSIGGSTKGFILKPYVRLYIESHIRGKLEELANSYLFAAQTLPFMGSQYEKNKEWLISASDLCNKLKEPMMSVRSLNGFLQQNLVTIIGLIWSMILFFIPNQSTVSPLVAQLISSMKLSGSNPEVVKAVSIGLPFLLAIIFSLILIFVSFRPAFLTKRAIFIPGYCFDEKPVQDESKVVYVLEDQLFTILNRKKMKEVNTDLYQLTIVVLITFLLVFILFWTIYRDVFIYSVLALGIIFVISFLVLVSDFRRVNRRKYC